MRLGLLLALLPGQVLSGAAFAECDPGPLRAADGPRPYRALPGGYCEGTFAVNAASPFQIFSFTIGAPTYDPAKAEIVIEAPLSSPGAPLHLRARGRPVTFGYQMDADILSPAIFRWSTSNALRPLRFERGDFGVFAMRIDGPTYRLVPVAMAGTRSDRLLLRLIAPEHLSGPVEYAVARPGSLPVWMVATRGSPNKGDVIDVVLPASAIALPVTFRMRAKSRRAPDRYAELAVGLSR